MVSTFMIQGCSYVRGAIQETRAVHTESSCVTVSTTCQQSYGGCLPRGFVDSPLWLPIRHRTWHTAAPNCHEFPRIRANSQEFNDSAGKLVWIKTQPHSKAQAAVCEYRWLESTQKSGLHECALLQIEHHSVNNLQMHRIRHDPLLSIYVSGFQSP